MIYWMHLKLKDKKKGIGLSFAWNGILTVIKTERNFRIHLFATLFVVMLALLLKLQIWEWIILSLVIGLVLITEMINSAIEQMIDYVKPEIHPKAKVIKDIGAGVVLITAIIASIIGLLLFIPKIVNVISF